MFPSIAVTIAASVGSASAANSAAADMIIPGVQYPHWNAATSRNARCNGWSLPVGASPSSVVTGRSATSAAVTMQIAPACRRREPCKPRIPLRRSRASRRSVPAARAGPKATSAPTCRPPARAQRRLRAPRPLYPRSSVMMAGVSATHQRARPDDVRYTAAVTFPLMGREVRLRASGLAVDRARGQFANLGLPELPTAAHGRPGPVHRGACPNTAW